MKKFLLSGIMGLCFSFAEGQVWKQLYDSTNYFWANDWPKTINLLLKAREDAVLTLGQDHPSYQNIIGDLGVAYWKNNQFEAARPFLTASIVPGGVLKQGLHATELINTITHFATSDLANHKSYNPKPILKWIVYNEQKPDDPLLYFGAVMSLVKLYNKQGLYDSAVDVTSHVNKQNGSNWSRNAEWNLLVAKTLYKAGKINEAAFLIDKNLRAKNTSGKLTAEYYSLRGATLISVGDFKSAIWNINKATRLASKTNDPVIQSEIYKNHINAYLAQKDYGKAEQMCDDFLKTTDPLTISTQHYAEVKNMKANIAIRQGRYGEAIRLYEELLPVYPRFVKESNPEFVAILNNLAQAYVETDQLHRAYVYLRWAYEMVNTRESRQASLAADILTSLAEVYASKGDVAQADQHLREARMLKPSH